MYPNLPLHKLLKPKKSNSLKKYEKSKNKGKRSALISTINQKRRAIENKILFSKKVNVINDDKEEEMVINYIIDDYLGDGTFGAVSRIKLITGINNKEYGTLAYKRVFEEINYQNREITILKTLNHPNIIKIFAFSYSKLKLKESSEEEDGRFANLYLEYVPYSFNVFIKTWPEKLSLEIYKKLFFQCLTALSYLHKKNICHRDLKPDNILITKDFIVKICDFGSAKILGSKGNLTYVMSRSYRAPENLLNNKNYTLLIDIWSLGIVFLEAFYSIINYNEINNNFNKFIVFSGSNSNEILIDILLKLKPNKADLKAMKVSTKLQDLIKTIKSNDEDLIPNIKGTFLLKNVLEKCICFNYKKRGSADEILSMSYFQDYNL